MKLDGMDEIENTLIIKSWIKFDHMDEISDMDAMQPMCNAIHPTRWSYLCNDKFFFQILEAS
jgi:hypothetical protein